ncbi:MAG: hypothetical protein J6S67_01120 [Methanobrevibacter sp.]|nr:hypothetical protein [Methanobrevibacter sp.]
MTLKEQEAIMQDLTWTKLIFIDGSVRGEIILKTSMYLKKMKKINKLFKGVDYKIIQGYTLNEEETLRMDSELNRIDARIKRLEGYLKYAEKRGDIEQQKELIKSLFEAEEEKNQRIKELIYDRS